MKQIPESELILNPDGSVYHLNLHPEELANTVINVGDPDRVAKVSAFFDTIEVRKQKREFVTHTGTYRGKRMTVLSTGIGTDNIDIVYNELDSLVNIDLKARVIKEEKTSLRLVRIGTSGSLQGDIPPDAFVCSRYGLGLDGLLNFYHQQNTDEEKHLLDAFDKHFPNEGRFPASYIYKSDDELFNALSPDMHTGITASCSGFYGPQGRVLRLQPYRHDIIERLSSFEHNGVRLTNFEMETGAMFGLARLLGHRSCAVNVIVANRIANKFSHDAEASMEKLIQITLDKLSLLND
ncbi:MAG: nucleoside phosphorylase [Bacteroidota bacterium]